MLRNEVFTMWTDHTAAEEDGKERGMSKPQLDKREELAKPKKAQGAGVTSCQLPDSNRMKGLTTQGVPVTLSSHQQWRLQEVT